MCGERPRQPTTHTPHLKEGPSYRWFVISLRSLDDHEKALPLNNFSFVKGSEHAARPHAHCPSQTQTSAAGA
ncbi:hypothetical protein [Dictyobacter kobayashii]|uniref:hypothetical protein n=1 Tax=Dictyobacter kobayashii TaxID=2014872 RepID=UPI000F81AFF7|nr:hypothetical protein [Dictyobacter kobayashii]